MTEAFGRVTGRFTSGSQMQVLLRKWNSSQPIVVAVVAIAIVATPVVISTLIVVATIAAVVSKTISTSDVAQLLLNL